MSLQRELYQTNYHRGIAEAKRSEEESRTIMLNPLRPNNDLSETSHCNIKGLSVSEVMRIENMITQVQLS